ncbi:MAG: Crp/Fnr family transcriptional regulator [Helicobacter sp.]|nr:Crp/Fnr family transcriptional regulator [Helicobacteraceae bacterium]MDY3113403.1 Crp/Fnr family transcriptional regulator [Helicobacter sp.]
MQISKNLSEFELFKNLDNSSIKKLEEILTYKHFTPKEIILYEEESVNALYILLSGEVKLYKVDRFENEIFLGILDSGILLEFNADNFSAFANIECTKECLVACFNGEKLRELLNEEINILRFFFKESHKKIALCKEVIKKNLIFDSTAKVAYSLFYELESFNSHKKQDNAALLNIQPETLSRILKKMHNQSIITTDSKGKIKIIDSQKLQNIFK